MKTDKYLGVKQGTEIDLFEFYMDIIKDINTLKTVLNVVIDDITELKSKDNIDGSDSERRNFLVNLLENKD